MHSATAALENDEQGVGASPRAAVEFVAVLVVVAAAAAAAQYHRSE